MAMATFDIERGRCLQSSDSGSVEMGKSMPESEIFAVLGPRKSELRRRLCEHTGFGIEPQPGSDVEVLLDALCGLSPESYRPAYAASARLLAEQGGRLEVRLESIQQWNAVLATAIGDLLTDQPSLAAEAQRFLVR